jgi:hypothetical protein
MVLMCRKNVEPGLRAAASLDGRFACAEKKLPFFKKTVRKNSGVSLSERMIKNLHEQITSNFIA